MTVPTISGSDRVDLFISYAGLDRPWAEWAAWQLLTAGYTVELDVWDWPVGENIVLRMNDVLARADRVVALYSPAYFDRTNFTTDYWTSVLAERPNSEGRRRLVPVRVANVEPPPTLASLIYCDVFDVPEEDARRRLLAAVKGSSRPSSAPLYPKLAKQERRLLSSPAAGNLTILVHFLDDWVLRSCGYGRGYAWLDRKLENEAKLAFRLIVLAADEILVPAACFFENPLCGTIVGRYKELWDTGTIKLISDASQWDEFKSLRIRQYSSDPQHLRIYSALDFSQFRLPALLGSSESSIESLHAEWRAQMASGGIESLMGLGARSGDGWQLLRPEMNRQAARIPEILGERAFIAENIYPLVYASEKFELFDELRVFLCHKFFRVLLRAFSAGAVTDLAYINRIVFPEVPSLSFRRLVRLLRDDKELWRDVRFSSCTNLTSLQIDERVRQIVAMTVQFPGLSDRSLDIRRNPSFPRSYVQ